MFEKRDFRKTVCPLFGVHFIKTMAVESPESAERKGVDKYAEIRYAQASKQARYNCALFSYKTTYIRDG